MALINSEEWATVASHEGGELKAYTTVINGIETTLRLSDADAEARGLTVTPADKAKSAPANKSGKAPANKGVSARKAAVADKAFGGAAKRAAAGDGAGDGA